MKTNYWQLLLISCVACAGTSCEPNAATPTNTTDISTPEATVIIGDDENDRVENQTWSETIHIVWDGSSASVTGSANDVDITNSNGYVTVQSTAKEVAYAVSGSGTGQLSIYSDYKFQLVFEGLTLSCSNGPAINNQCHKTCYVVLNSENSLSDGSIYATSTEDRKAAFFSEGQLCFSGSGSLSVTANSKHALASDDYIRLCEGMTGSIALTAKVSDGLHTNDGILIEGGELTVNAADEGLRCDSGALVISGGKVHIFSQTEAVESKSTITISGGELYAQAKDDAINSGDDLIISGGYVCAYSTGNDGIDANGNCYIQGGVVYAIGARSPEVAIDANSEEQKKLYVQGGTLVAIGGLESGASLTQNCYSASWSANTWYALTVGSEVFAFKTPASGGNTMVVSGASTPTLYSGVTASGTELFNGMAYYPATANGGSNVSLSSYTGGNGGGPSGVPGGNRPGRFMIGE